MQLNNTKCSALTCKLSQVLGQGIEGCVIEVCME